MAAAAGRFGRSCGESDFVMPTPRAAGIAALRFRDAAFAWVMVAAWALASHASTAHSPALDARSRPALAADTATARPRPVATPAPDRAAMPVPQDLLPGTEFRADSARWHFEVGSIADYTNEVFYEDAFIDTTFLGRNRVQDPEGRIAGVLFAALDGTRGAGQTRYQLQNEWSIGNLLQRGTLGLNWRSEVSPEWRVTGTPSVEFRRDQTYGRDLREWRAQVSGRARRTFFESATALDIGASADMVRTDGTGADFVLDRNSVRAGAGLDYGALGTFGARAGYALVVRQFPDSSGRDHLEHQTEVRLRQDRDRGVNWGLDGTLLRRATLQFAPTSRDNWWQEISAFDAEWRDASAWSLRGRAEFDALQYDVQDSTTFFNYSTLRVLAGPRFGRAATLALWLAPRLEWLRAPLAPGEDYREYAGQVECEYVSAKTMISATPVVGHREYERDPRAFVDESGSIHDSYSFLELTFFFDQSLPAGWRMRALGTARSDLHSNAAENATSLYFSLDVRRLF